MKRDDALYLEDIVEACDSELKEKVAKIIDWEYQDMDED